MTWKRDGSRYTYYDATTGLVSGIVNDETHHFAAWHGNTKFLGNYTELPLAQAAVVTAHGA